MDKSEKFCFGTIFVARRLWGFFVQQITVAKYIETQEEHHTKKTFIEEYKKILKDFDLEYDERYIFKEIE